MIYLNRKQFLPAMVLINVMFLPIILTLAVLCFLYHVLTPLPIIGILLVVYLLFVFCVSKSSKSSKKYLIIHDDYLDICCGNKYCDSNTGLWTVSYNKIQQIDYYRVSSLKGWLIVWSYLFPKCVFITIQDCYGKEESVFIGYMDLYQVTMIAEKGNIELVIH